MANIAIASLRIKSTLPRHDIQAGSEEMAKFIDDGFSAFNGMVWRFLYDVTEISPSSGLTSA